MIEKPSRCYFMFKCEAEAQISVLLMIIHRGGMSFETETDTNSECNWLYKKSVPCWRVSFRLVYFYGPVLLKEKLKKHLHPF